eukprot:scaffold5331_cov85-Skeletonema_dohrnii-CCMP3373.AAC.2
MVTLIVVRVSSSTAPAEAGGSTLNCHRLNHDEIKTKSAAVAAAATAAGNDEDEGYLGSLINRESQLLKITKAKACTVTVAAARLSNIDDSDPYVDAASRRKRQPFRLCSAGGCTNQARAAGVCWSHGAKPPPILNVNLCSSARAALTPTAALKNEEDPGPGALINSESQLKKAKACTVAAARPSNIYGSVPYHVLVDEASQRKRQRSGSVGEDIVPKKTARMQSTATEARDGGMCIRYGAKVKPKKCSSEGVKNTPTTSIKMEAYARGMEQRPIPRNATLRDVQIRQDPEAYARGMGQRSRNVAVKDVQISLKMEECAGGMEQKLRPRNAAVKDAPTSL